MSVSQVNSALQGIKRPMRGLFPKARRRNEKLARQLLKAVDDRHVQWMDEIFDIVPILPEFSTTRNEKVLPIVSTPYDIEITELIAKELDLTWCEHHKHYENAGKKVIKIHGDLPAIESTFIANFGATVNARMNKATARYLDEIAGSGPAAMVGTKTIWGNNMNEGFQIWVDDSRTQSRTEWDKQPKNWKELNPFDEFFDRTFWAGSEFVNDIYSRGFNLIQSNITIQFAANAKEIMNDGLTAGKSHQQIARDLNNKIGTRMIAKGRPAAGLYHWSRLVRSEIANSISSTLTATYQQQGITLMKYSAAVDACPICVFWATQNNGIYLIDNFPDIIGDTHPNCRCFGFPVYRLSPNQSSNAFLPSNPFIKN